MAEWHGLSENRRQSREIEWAQAFPQFAVSKWIGYSIAVSDKHYANIVPDELFERMARGGRVAQKEAQQTSETTCSEQKMPTAEKSEENVTP